MQIVESRTVTQFKKLLWFTPTSLLTGCSLSPAIPVIGAYYPSWLFCILVGVVLTLITRRLILRHSPELAYTGVVYTALFALYAMLFWLIFF
ncbi:TPA: hypothetical protein N2G30_002668 [Salmonella enterica]|nr:hypothetical protein [Salmonella enterica]